MAEIERTSYEVSKLIYDYFKSGRVPDLDFINKVVEIVVVNFNLNKYVRGDVEIDDDGDFAFYNQFTKRISINFSLIQRFIKSEISYLRFNRIEIAYYVYTIFTQCLLHELDHASQCQKIDFAGNDIETLVLIASNNDYLTIKSKLNKVPDAELKRYIAEQHELYKKLYIYNPSERLAEVCSHILMMEILKSLNTNITNLIQYERMVLNQCCLRGYGGFIPTKYFLEQTGVGDKWQSIADTSEHLDFQTRISLGLGISEDELASFREDTQKLERKLII